MKNHLLRNSGRAFILAAALLSAPVLVIAQATPAPAAPDAKLSKNVSGKVEAKSDTTLTVSGRTVSTSSSTTFSKAGASIGSADIKVGDKVTIVTSDDGQVAVSVDVISSE